MSETFNIFGYTISTIFIILFLSSLVSMFVYWYEVQRDGFDEESALDLFLICLFSGVVLSRFTYGVVATLPPRDLVFHILKFWQSGFNVIGLALGLIFPIILFTKSWKWSLYRISDIFVLSLSLGSTVLLAGLFLFLNDYSYLIFCILYFLIFVFLYFLRYRIRSGMVFSLFLMINVVFGVTLWRDTMYLIFYALLITISLVNLISRERKDPMKTSLSSSFINKIKALLSSKEKELRAEQKLLLDEDPYLSDGRDSDNEYLDDVTEDVQKETNDMRLSNVKNMQSQVKKALARIEAGEYGICEKCGNAIEQDRLEAIPDTSLCAKCAELNVSDQ